MGFLDKLRLNGVFNPNPAEPLFGGLIPRREFERIRPERTSFPQGRSTGKDPIQSQNMGVSKGMLSREKNPSSDQIDRPRTVRFEDDYIDRARLSLDRDKLRHAMNIDVAQLNQGGEKISLDKQKLASDEKLEGSELEISQRKQALDEWQAMNPNGEIKTDVDGNIVVINKVTGASINTGLKSGDLTEDEKIKRNIAGQITVEGVRQKGRLEAIDKRNEIGDRISPTQQRAAEDDAFAELMNDPRFAEIADYIDRETGQITRAEVGGGFAGFGGTTEQEAINVNNIIDQFESLLKENSTARMSRRVGGNESSSETVEMITPDGRPMPSVPKSDVDRLKGFGAKVVGEENIAAKTPIEARDDIELLFDADHKVVGAKNKKAKPKREQ